MNTAVRRHEVERPDALGQRTGVPPAQKGAETEATRAQVPLLSAAEELVAVLEAFGVSSDSNGNGRKDEPRGPERAVAARGTNELVASTTSLRVVNPAHSAAPATSANEGATAKSPAVTLLPAWRDYVAQFRTPNARYLVITAKDQASLYDFFRRTFAGVETVEVRMDRRLGERRPQADSATVDARHADRRSRPEIDAELRASGFAFVRSMTSPEGGRASSSPAAQAHPPAPGRAPSPAEPLRRSPFRRGSSGHKGTMLGDSPLGGDVRIHPSQETRPQRTTLSSH